MHDLLPTDRLAAIHLTDTTACLSCGHPDSLQHRITECGVDTIIRTWTKKILGYMLGVDLRYIPPEWTIRLAFRPWPAQKQSAVLWVLAHLVNYRLQAQLRLSLLDNMDFFALGQVEAIPPSPQAPGYRQVFGCHRLDVAVM
jgi:hypothetical protein